MILGEFMEQEVVLKEEYNLPPVKRIRWQRVAYLLWKNNKVFALSAHAIGFGKHPNMTPLEITELFEYKAIIFGASMYTAIWEEQYIPLVTEYMNGLDVKKKLFENQVKYN